MERDRDEDFLLRQAPQILLQFVTTPKQPCTTSLAVWMRLGQKKARLCRQRLWLIIPYTKTPPIVASICCLTQCCLMVLCFAASDDTSSWHGCGRWSGSPTPTTSISLFCSARERRWGRCISLSPFCDRVGMGDKAHLPLLLAAPLDYLAVWLTF